jgi:delta14-sterol reductase
VLGKRAGFLDHPAPMAAALGLLAFLAGLFAAAKVVPGRDVEGRAEPDGTRLRYRINGMAQFVAINLAVATGTLVFDLSLAPLIEHFWTLFIAANAISFALAFGLYLRGVAARPGRTTLGEKLLGIERNPRVFGVDLELWAYEPSLLGFALLVAAFGYEQFERYGEITPQMGLWIIGWWVYVATHYAQQAFLLSIFDVIEEKFGLMLVWGDLVLVPFFYSIAGWWLLDQREPIAHRALLAIGALYAVSLWMFRGANAQKWRFKQDPAALIWGEKAEAIGGSLLISGWWGIGRHLNYTGEIGVYLALTLATGFGSLVPYLLPLWMLVRLAHRAARDDRRCRAKYGALWTAYCAHTRFRMFPYLY